MKSGKVKRYIMKTRVEAFGYYSTDDLHRLLRYRLVVAGLFDVSLICDANKWLRVA